MNAAEILSELRELSKENHDKESFSDTKASLWRLSVTWPATQEGAVLPCR